MNDTGIKSQYELHRQIHSSAQAINAFWCFLRNMALSEAQNTQ